MPVALEIWSIQNLYVFDIQDRVLLSTMLLLILWSIARSSAPVILPHKNVQFLKSTTTSAVARNETSMAFKYRGPTVCRKQPVVTAEALQRRSRTAPSYMTNALWHMTWWKIAKLQIRIALLNAYSVRGFPLTDPIG